jgi:uncharacterized protein
MKQLSYFVKTYPYSDGSTILYSTLTGGTALVSGDLLERLDKGEITPEENEALDQMQLMIDNPADERQDILNLFDHWNRSRRTLNVIAVMNLSCNLQCVYCFEGDRKGSGIHMSQETADKLVKFLSEKVEGNDTICITFYGGEPLLSLYRIQDISEKMATIAQRSGVKYEFSLVTNGTLLTPAIVDSLLSLGLKSIKVTIDGPRDVHDSQRPRLDGTGSFDTIVQNIKLACERIGVQIGGNYSQTNYGRFPELLDYLLEDGIDPGKLLAVKFDPVSEPEVRYKLPSFGGGCKSINETWLAEASIYLREEILKRGFFTPPIRITPCMTCFHKEYVVNHDGALYKCPGFICHEDYCIGHLGGTEIKIPDIYNLDLWKNDRCLGCIYLPLCFGGCRYMEFTRTGKIGNVDCRYDFIEATLGVFIAQDIKYGKER